MSTWEEHAQNNAFYAVCTNQEKWTPSEFYSNGLGAWKNFKRQVGKYFPIEFNLVGEIGCGPGRLLFPAAKEFVHAVGWDISRTMLNKGVSHQEEFGSSNISWINNLTLRLPSTSLRFNLIYSVAVFQHFRSQELICNFIQQAYQLLAFKGVLIAVLFDWKTSHHMGEAPKQGILDMGAAIQEARYYKLLADMPPYPGGFHVRMKLEGGSACYIFRRE